VNEAMQCNVDCLAAADPEKVCWNKDGPASGLSDRCKDPEDNGLW
jgi:hypothetical protein